MNIEVNPIYYRVLTTRARVVVLFGGADSGKSFFIGRQYIPLMLLSQEHFKCLAVRKTEVSIADSSFAEIVDGIEAMGPRIQSLFDINKSRGSLKIRCRDTGNEVLFKGLDKVSKLKSISNINCVWVEEAEEINQEEYLNLLLRLRGGGYERIILTFNPVDENHFSRTMFQDCPYSKEYLTDNNRVWQFDVTDLVQGRAVSFKTLVINSTYQDNLFIGEQRKLALETLKNTNEMLYKVLAQGQYGSLGERIFTNWSVIQLDVHDTTTEYNYDNLKFGLDWGFYPDPFRFLMGNIDLRSKVITIIDEIDLLESTNSLIAEKIIALLNKYDLDTNVSIICDSAQPKDIYDLRHNYGLNTKAAKKGPGSIKTGINKLREFKIEINSTCTETIKDFQWYSYKKDRAGNIINEPADSFNHSPDILRYMVEEYSIGQRKVRIM